MTYENLQIAYGKGLIDFRLIRRDRKTLSVYVNPDLSVEVIAPKDAPLETILSKVHKRASWITRQIHYLEQFQPRTPQRIYVSGETHRYLGRQYKLKVISSAKDMIKIQRGQIFLWSTKPKNNKKTRKMLRDWLLRRAKDKFSERLYVCRNKFSNPDKMTPNNLIVRDLSHRWGSMTKRGNLILNRTLIGASTDTIDYVITHELCHIENPHHGREFFDLLQKVMPDWRKRKNKLERQMA